MRDPARIKRILDKIEQLWYKYPDQRLGQLIENYAIDPRRLFFQEDTETEAQLELALRTDGHPI